MHDDTYAHGNIHSATLPMPADLIAVVDMLFPGNALAGARYSAVIQTQIDTELLPG